MTFHWRSSRARAAVGRPLFDDAVMLLEDRIMLDAVPVVSVTTPDHVLLSNPANNFQVTLTFDNTGSQAGFGPYVEVFVPKNGADGVAHGAANADGATFVKATYLGQAVNVAANLTFDASGHATNPLSGDVVSGTPGDGLVVLQLPFGSFTGPQTPAALIATFAQSPLGNVGVPLTIAARGGFQFRVDSLDNPASDPHIVGATASASYTPTLAVLTKTSDAPKNLQEETATGPNNDHFYTLNLDVANGQTLTNALLSDALPDSIVYLGATVAPGVGTITHQPVIGSVVDPADNLLSVRYTTLTGGPGTSDAVVTVHFYVADKHFDGTPVVDPTTGAKATTVNNASLAATFTPIDAIDPIVAFELDATKIDTISDKPVAIQKSAAIVVDTGPAGLNSGDTIEYKLTIQLSDYFTLGNLSLNDVLSDGQRLDTSFLPTIALIQRGIASPVAPLAGVTVNPVPNAGDTTTGREFIGNFASSFDKVAGTTTSTINLSAALILGGLDSDGALAGGRTQPDDAAANTSGTTVTITFRAVTQNNFESDAVPAANRAVHQGDTLGNTIAVAASVCSNADPAIVLDPVAVRDDGAASLTVARGDVGKAIYAINGDTNLRHFTVGSNIQLSAGDTITYRLIYDLPITSYQALSLTDFLPLPVLASQTLTFNSAAPFTAGNYGYGPTDTLHLQTAAPVPTETFDPTGNSVRFAYADYAIQNTGSPSKASKIDLLFSIAIQDTTIADGLFLTNLATSSESNTPGNATMGDSIVRFALGQPRLLVQKAIVSATNGTITNPETVAGVTFLAPGVTAGGRGYTFATPATQFTDLLLGASIKAAAPKLNSNVVGLDGGDDARVAIVINNQGNSTNGAFNTVLDDVLAPGTSFRGGGLATANLIVTRGDGTIFTPGTDYTVTSTAAGLSIQFVDTAAARIEQNGAADRGDIVIVTYDIHLDNAVAITPTALTSSATISKFTAVPGGLNQAIVPPTDNATIKLLQPAAIKTLLSTTDASTTGGKLTIGENATYEVTYTFAEGTTSAVRLIDLLPRTAASGTYQFVSASIVSVGSNLKQADGITAVNLAYLTGPVFSLPTNGTLAKFGGAGKTIVDVADNIATTADSIVIDYVVRATTVASNVDGLNGLNSGQIIFGATNTRVSATAPIGISLPDLTVVKAFVPSGAADPDANDPVSFTITVANPGTVTGYNLSLADPFPAGTTMVSVTGVTGAGLVPGDFAVVGNTLTLTNHINLLGGQSFTISVAAKLSSAVHPGDVLTNTATLGFNSATGVPPAALRTVIKTSSAQVPIAPDTIAKTIFTSSVGNDSSSMVDIGETITFDLTTTLAEGLSDALTISDALPAGLTFVSGQLVAVGANISGATLNPALTTPGGVPTFAFGNVVNAANNLPQTSDDQIVIRITARVADVLGNTSGTVLTDIASVATFVGGSSKAQTSSLPVTVVVPDLVVSKALTSAAMPDAGDVTTFTINIHHTALSTATAYNLIVLDALPAELRGLEVVAVNNDPEGDGANGLALTTASFTTTGGVLALASPLGLALKQSFTVTIAAVVADTTVVGSTITNAASVPYSTLPGGDPHGRITTRGATATFTTASFQDLVKVITATDDPLTESAQVRPGVTDLGIGEAATVQLTATFAQGTTPGVVIVDRLPTNAVPGVTGATFGFVGVPVLTPGAGVTFTGSGVGVLSDSNGDGVFDTVTYTLGSVTVPGTPGAGTGGVTITYQTTPLDRPENAAGDTLSSPATLTSALGSLTRATAFDLVAPNIAMTKTAATGFTPAGAFVNYTITLANTGTGPAADLVVADLLPPGVVQLGPPLIALNGGPAAPGAFNLLPVLGPGDRLDITISAAATPAAVVGTVQTNTASVAYDSHAGPGGRPGTGSASAGFVVPGSQALTKAVTATSEPLTGAAQFRPAVTDLAIGETATVQLVTTLHQGTTTNVVITDRLPVNTGPAGTAATFGFDSPVILTLPPGTTITGTLTPVLSDSNGDGINDTVTFTLGSVTIPAPAGGIPGIIGDATAALTIGYVTRVLDRAENQAGDALASPASLASGLGVLAANVNFDLVAPTLVVTKTVTVNPGGADAGDAVVYTIHLANTGTGPAADIVLTDVVPAGVVVVAGRAVSVDGGPYLFQPIPTLAPGSVADIFYTAVVRDSAVAGSVQTNVAMVAYDSVTGPGGRPDVAQASASFTTLASQTLTKAVTATSEPLTGNAQFRPGVTDLAVGETATVQLLVTFQQGTTPNVVIVDRLPVNTGLTGTSATFGFSAPPVLTLPTGATITGSLIPMLIDSNGDGITDTVRFTLGDVTIPGGLAGASGPGTAALTIGYTTRVLDRPENQAGDTLASPVSLTSGLGVLAANVDYDLVAPVLVLTKSVTTTGTPDAGDTVSYLVTLTNTGSGPAAGITVADPGAPGVRLGSAVVTAGGVSTTLSLGGPVTVPALLPGASATITYAGVVTDAAVAGAAATNTATASYSSTSAPAGRPASTSASATFTTASFQDLVKVITATDDPLTESAQVRPGVTDLGIGEAATVQLTATFAQGTTPGVVIVDRLPTNAVPGVTGATFGFVGVPVLTPGAGVTFTGSGVGVLSDSNGDGVFDTVTYTLGSVTVPGTPGAGTGGVTITYQTTPLDRPENAAGDTLSSPATLTSALGSLTRATAFDLVAPNIALTKTVATTGTPDAGDTVTYTVTLTNVGTGPAADISLTDVAAPGIITGSATVTVGGTTTNFGSAGAIALATLGTGQTATITYSGKIADGAVGGMPITNTANATYDSHPGPGGRPAVTSATASFTTAGVQSLIKSVVATSEPFTGSDQFRPDIVDLTIGEIATIELRVSLSEGTTRGVVLTDTLTVPGGTLKLTGTPVIVFADGSTVPFEGTIVFDDLNGDGTADQVRFVLGDVVIPGDNSPANNFIALRYQASVADQPENVAGNQLNLAATLTSAIGTSTATVGVDLVAPALIATKTLALDQPLDGLSSVFVLTVAHTANSSAAATSVVLTDLVPAGTLLSGNAIVINGPAGTVVKGNTVSVPLLARGDTLVVRITTVSDFDHFVVGTSVNRAIASYATTTGGGVHQRLANASATIPQLTGVSSVLHPHETMHAPVERRYVTPLMPIEPVYSGGAEPGSFIEIVVTDEFGSISSEGGALTDAGGNWLIRQPSASVDTLLRNGTLSDYYESTRLFSAPAGDIFASRDLFGEARINGRINVGAIPSFGTQIVHVNVTGSIADFTTPYAPTWRDQVFVEAPGLSVERAFAGAAGRSVTRLYDDLASPEAAGLNRFNRAFLTVAGLS